MTSFTKIEVHNILHCYQRGTKPWRQTTENLTKFGPVVFTMQCNALSPSIRLSQAGIVSQVAQLSLTNPHDALHHDKPQNFKTVT